MNWIFGIVKGIVYFLLFSSILEQLVWDTKMEKYIRFFTGLLLCMVLVNSVSKGIDFNLWEKNVESWYQDIESEEEEFEIQEKKIRDKIESYQEVPEQKKNKEKDKWIEIEPIEIIP